MTTIPKDILQASKLYSPGPIPQHIELNIDFSHRSPEFRNLYSGTIKKLRDKFKIPDKYEIIFTQGSGTSAIETILSCVKGFPRWHSTGTFTQRSIEMSKFYGGKPGTNRGYHYYTQFETSESRYYSPEFRIDEEIKKEYPGNLLIVDCVSGFGFYPLPDSANVIIASSSKILGGLPAMGIILYDKEALSRFEDHGDYLNILKYIKYAKKNETPHTSLIPQLWSLNSALNNVISREQIEENCRAVHSDKIQFIGETVCPVLTIQVKDPDYWVQKFRKFNAEVYWNPAYMTDHFQVSAFNYRDPKYYHFVREVLEGKVS